MVKKLFLFSLLLMVSLGSIGFIFWKQELQYALPTPVPEDLKLVSIHDEVDLNEIGIKSNGKATFIHFYNFDCPCSRFNIKDFSRIVKTYEDDVDFIAVLQSKEENLQELEEFKNKYGLGIPIVMDHDGVIARELGVYSTPQAVIVNTESKIFFKGNYNKARFCTTKNTRFAELALGALVSGKEAPIVPELALVPYGCSLPVYDANEDQHDLITNLFRTVYYD